MRRDSSKVFSIIRTHLDSGAVLSGTEEAIMLCPNPDHVDRNRSNCSVNLKKQVWHCFSCGDGGSLQKALRYVKAYSVSVPSVSPANFEDAHEDVIIDKKVLTAYEYYADPWIDAGFSEDLLDDHCIGYDIHNHRITIPLYNKEGDLIGISGRATRRGQEPRYKIYKSELGKFAPYDYSPKTHSHLWRFNQCNQLDGPILVVEGFKAALWAVQCGYKKTVALCGASMTQHQAQLLIEHNKPVILMLDQDEAGRKGTRNCGIRLCRAGLSVSVVDYGYPAPDDIPSDDFLFIITNNKKEFIDL